MSHCVRENELLAVGHGWLQGGKGKPCLVLESLLYLLRIWRKAAFCFSSGPFQLYVPKIALFSWSSAELH
jgi:hypothetical protein